MLCAGFVADIPVMFGLRDQGINLRHLTFPGLRRDFAPADFLRQRGPSVLLQSNKIRMARFGDDKLLDGIVHARRVRQVVPDPSRILLVAGLSGGFQISAVWRELLSDTSGESNKYRHNDDTAPHFLLRVI